MSQSGNILIGRHFSSDAGLYYSLEKVASNSEISEYLEFMSIHYGNPKDC